MDIILNAIKCAICHEILESPVFLPCSDTICKKHVSNQSNNVIRCEKCGVEHQIPTNGFPPIPFLEAIIKSDIGHLDFGSVHKEAKKSCESFEEALKELEVLLKDPYVYTHERISELKNSVQLKGEELKLIIDQEMKKLFDRFDDYERQSKDYLSSNKFRVESQKLENELKLAQSNLDSWLESLNKIKFDEQKWKRIKEESDQKLKIITEELDKLKIKLLLNKYGENQTHVNFFKSIKIHSLFENIPINSELLDSIIINESLIHKLEELLEKKELNGRKWSLLYRGSRDGFRGSNFHSNCDNKPNTLTIVKSTSGNIFGGFTSAQWSSTVFGTWEDDKSAFIFSLLNKENRSLIFENKSNNERSICSYEDYGPIFGRGNDIFISDYSNTNTDTNTNSYSNLGKTYTHPDYPHGSEKAKTILAGSFNFQVQEIEVFQMEQ